MIVVGATTAAFSMDNEGSWGSWLKNAEAIKESHPDGVSFFAALQVDARGTEPFLPLIQRLEAIGGSYWTYSLDDGRTEVTSGNRVRHICLGRNILTEFASGHQATHLLYLDADCTPPADILPKLLEVNYPLVAGYIPSYGLGGPLLPEYPFPVMDCWASAGCILAAYDVFNRLRWRWDMKLQLTDDPCYYKDAIELLDVRMRVRKDIEVEHYPGILVPVDHRGHDMTVVR